jgi:hypothetical protein
MNEIIKAGPNAHLPQTAQEIRETVNRIQEIMKHVMKKDTHYGVIPGTDKPTLYKPGAEKLLSTFHISVQPKVDDLSTDTEIRYRVQCEGLHMGTGILVGVGVGECSTGEEKYKWRAAVCDDEYEDTDTTRRRIKYGWKWGQQQGEKITTRIKQVRRDPSDLANTVLKMAKKRAEVDLCLTALAASDIFVQDIEDLPEGLAPEPPQGAPNPKAQTQAPRPANSGVMTGLATEPQQKLLMARCGNKNIPISLLLAQFQYGDITEFEFAKVNDALAWIDEQQEPPR